MAAPPAKPSPSNQAVQQSDNAAAGSNNGQQPEVQLKAPPSYATVTTPTYASVEASENFRLAKDLLNAGSFEEALSVLEQELETTKTMLVSAAGAGAIGEGIAVIERKVGLVNSI